MEVLHTSLGGSIPSLGKWGHGTAATATALQAVITQRGFESHWLQSVLSIPPCSSRLNRKIEKTWVWHRKSDGANCFSAKGGFVPSRQKAETLLECL